MFIAYLNFIILATWVAIVVFYVYRIVIGFISYFINSKASLPIKEEGEVQITLEPRSNYIEPVEIIENEKKIK